MDGFTDNLLWRLLIQTIAAISSTSSISQFLDALELSQSPLLLKLLAGILCRDTKHIMEDQFQTCFQRTAKRQAKVFNLLEPHYSSDSIDLYCSTTRRCSCMSCFHYVQCFCQCLFRASVERQLQLLCTVYGVIQQGDVPMSSMLQAMMERVLLPLASHCSAKALNDFFITNVFDIISFLLSRFTKVCL